MVQGQCLAVSYLGDAVARLSPMCSARFAADRTGAAMHLLGGNVLAGRVPDILRMEDFAPHARKTVLQERLIRNDKQSLEMAV